MNPRVGSPPRSTHSRVVAGEDCLLAQLCSIRSSFPGDLRRVQHVQNWEDMGSCPNGGRVPRPSATVGRFNRDPANPRYQLRLPTPAPSGAQKIAIHHVKRAHTGLGPMRLLSSEQDRRHARQSRRHYRTRSRGKMGCAEVNSEFHPQENLSLPWRKDHHHQSTRPSHSSTGIHAPWYRRF
ncbi:hypothetical protein BD311DRAFT_237577 [Dichomitus squalens]|uniref:Uncharacterized protein n=1 Tax=Dichomitus squalens TaxID=114155 RepID=A0A4Q9M6Z9_9APHY|nr:hypothetical protein BD311DRAFT_237577 [Dichomitus squalens]